jgi:DNA-binding MarR family transcriptional regulator
MAAAPEPTHEPVSEGEARPDTRLLLAQEISQMVLAVSRRLQEGFGRHADRYDLTPSQAKVLVALGRERDLPMRMLAERLGFDPSNLTAPVDELERRGLVERVPHPRDRRVRTLRPTAEGERVRQAFFTQMSQDVSFADQLDDEQLAALRELLAIIVTSR